MPSSSSILLDFMAQRLLSGQHAAVGLTLFLFVFMFLPTLFVLVAVIVFFGLYYPRLRNSYGTDRERELRPKQVETRS